MRIIYIELDRILFINLPSLIYKKKYLITGLSLKNKNKKTKKQTKNNKTSLKQGFDKIKRVSEERMDWYKGDGDATKMKEERLRQVNPVIGKW